MLQNIHNLKVELSIRNTHRRRTSQKASEYFLCCLRTNVAYKDNFFVKLRLFKSILLSILLHAYHCLVLSRQDARKLEAFQKKSVE